MIKLRIYTIYYVGMNDRVWVTEVKAISKSKAIDKIKSYQFFQRIVKIESGKLMDIIMKGDPDVS